MTKQATPHARLIVVRMLRCRLNFRAAAASAKMELTLIWFIIGQPGGLSHLALIAQGLHWRQRCRAPGREQGGSNRHHRQRAERPRRGGDRSEEHTSELQSPCNLVCRLLLA